MIYIKKIHRNELPLVECLLILKEKPMSDVKFSFDVFETTADELKELQAYCFTVVEVCNKGCIHSQ